MMLSGDSPSRPAGHVRVPAVAIGSLSTLLAAGLSALGILDRVNGMISQIVSHGRTAGFPKALPEWSLWLAAVLFAFGLAFTVLGVAGTWRRVMLWITAVMLVGGWAPVLALAAHAPDIGAPLIATLWSGVCALVYATNHRMAADKISSDLPYEAR